jgi:hypothetical protein
MIKITCDNCKRESSLSFYFYDVRIIIEADPTADAGRNYTASACARATCPHCGEDVRRHFTNPIFGSDIIELAIRREL